MNPLNAGSRARILIRIEELAKRLGALQRRLSVATVNARPVLEVGAAAIRRELARLSKELHA